MKKLLFKIALLFLPIAIMMRFLASFDRQIITDDLMDVKRVLASEPFDSLDCLFLGSSYTYSSLNPQQFDSLAWKTYNLSIGGTGIYFLELIWQDYLKQHKQAPKRVIIDISPQTFSNQTDDWTAYPIHRHLLAPISHEALVWRYAVLSDYFKLLRKSAYKGWKNIGKRQLIPDLNQDSFAHYRGFYANYTRIDAEIKKRDANLLKDLYQAKIVNKKWVHLVEFIAACKRENIKCYWFVAPTPNLLPYYRIPYLDAYEDLLKKLRTIEGAIEIPIDNRIFVDSDYRNTDHLNVWGAEKLGKIIIDFLLMH